MRKKYKLNKLKVKVNYKVEIFTLSIFACALMLFCWAYIIQESDKYVDSVMKNYSSSQEALVSQVSKDVKAAIFASLDEIGDSTEPAESDMVMRVINNAVSSGDKYWFLYSSDGVIFEKSANDTISVKGKSISELVQYWKLQGGSGMETFEKMLLEDQNGSSVFAKNAKTEDEIVSWKHFTVNDKSYFLGVSTQKSYVMTIARAKEHILYLYTFAAAVCLNFLILVLFICMTISKNHMETEKSNKSIINKSLQIEELNRKLNSKSEAVHNAIIYDGLTKLYNRKFFDNLIGRIKNELLLPIGIVVIDINGLGKLNSLCGYSAGDTLLEKTSEILHRVCLDTDVMARTGSSEFTILMTGTKECEAYGTAENIKRQFDSLDKADLTLSIGVSEMGSKDEDIFAAMEHARKNLTLDKMLDSNSVSNCITSMLLETLGAYSNTTVAHCNRLRTLAIDLGNCLELKHSELSRLAVAAQLHDIGKIGFSDSILNKKDPLTQSEKDIIHRHSEIGYQIVNIIPALDEVAVDIQQHHEYFDGTGYPSGIAGEEITLNARIINIIDSFDAMTHPSVYATIKTVDEALSELCKKSGIQYDPYILSEFVKMVENTNRENIHNIDMLESKGTNENEKTSDNMDYEVS